MKKLVLFFWCLYFSATCKQITATDLVFVNASYQSWSGGAAGSGQGTNYYFNFLIKKKSKITCDSVWVDGYVLPVFAKVSGDTLHITARAFFRRPMGQMNGQKTVEPVREAAPIADKAAAVISYTNGGAKRFATVSAMKRLQPIAYP